MDARRGHAAVSSLAQKDLVALLSGTLTRKQTRGAFARRRPTPPMAHGAGRRRELTARQLGNRGLRGQVPVNPVNVQSGRLRGGTRLRRGNLGAQDFRLVVSGVEYARYALAIGGTSKMVSRQVQPELRRRWTPRNRALLDRIRASRALP